MSKKTLYLIASILGFLIFVGYMCEPGPHEMFGFSVSIWVMRFLWLIFTVSSIIVYLKLKDAEKKPSNS